MLQATSRALDFLQTRPQSDGLYGDEGSSVAGSALTLLALRRGERLSPADTANTLATLLAKQHADGSWGGSIHQTAQVVRALRFLLVPNLVLDQTGVSLSGTQVVDGELVSLDVRVANRGAAASAATTVQAYDSWGRALASPVIVPELAGGAWTDVRLFLDTLGHGPSSQVFVVVDPDGNLDETRKDDNRAAATLEIQPPPVTPDLLVSAGSLELSTSVVDRVPTQLSVTAQVRNIGTTEATNVEAALVVGGVVIGRTILGTMAGLSSSVVTLTGTITQIEGQRLPVLVIVDPENLVEEADESNNSDASSLQVVPTVDLEVLSLQAPPSIEQGGTLPISFLVANQGAADAVDGRVEVRVFDPVRQTRMTIDAFGQAVGKGAIVSASTNWKTNLTGDLMIEVEAFAGGEVNAADNLATLPVTVTTSPMANLFVRAQDMRIQPAPPLEGATASLAITVTNSGQPAGPFAVDLFKGDPANGGTLLGRKTVEALGADATTSVSFDLGTMPATSSVVVVVVDPEDVVDELDELDNRTAWTIAPLTRPDLLLASTGIGLSDGFPVAGATVTITASVSNLGGQALQPVPVELFLGGDAGLVVAVDPSSGAARELLPAAYGAIASDPLGGAVAVGWHPPTPPPSTPPCECCNCDCECDCDCSGPAITPYLAFVALDGTQQLWPLEQLPWDLRWSPNGTFVVIDQETALLTLANQSMRLVASRRSGETSISFTGTSVDVNYDHHELRARRLPDGRELVVTRSREPVVDALFAKWVPPGPGIYEATLTATDLAGNVKTARTKFGWSDRPVIAAISRDPEFISPNGDGIQDSTLFKYTVTAPTSVDFAFYDEAGTLARTIVRTHLETGEYSFTWDGLDDHGVLLPDGPYLAKCEGNALRVLIDTVAPSVEQGFSVPLPSDRTDYSTVSEGYVACLVDR